MTDAFHIRSVQAFCYRYPLTTPVVTSFGTMRDRPAVFIRVEDSDGVVGWGEVWCNFPAVGAEHRTRLINDMLAPMLAQRSVTHPSEVFEHLSTQMSVMALQSGEPGPFAQASAGIDIALWDVFAQRARSPLWRLLGGTSGRMRVYASGINPTGSVAMAEAALERGHRAFKLKIGFDTERDVANLTELRRVIGSDPIAVDVNQAWTLEQAMRLTPALEQFDLAWLEEPLRADLPWPEWQTLKQGTAIPLAGGENIAGRDAFSTALAQDVFSVVQPDVAKWGGITGCIAVARDVIAAGRMYCPHYLGGGIGLLASAHLLAAAGGAGMLEVDSNDNPLRDQFCGAVASIEDGWIELPEASGLGIAPDIAAIERYRTL